MVSAAPCSEAQTRGLTVFDATCPLVTKVHVEVAKLHQEGLRVLMIGHKDHPEVEGTMGQLDSGIHLVQDVADVALVQPTQTERLAMVTQTTLSVDDAAEIAAAIRARFPPGAQPPSSKDIATPRKTGKTRSSCFHRRWTWSSWWAAPPAPTANRLAELARKLGVPSYMVDGPQDLAQVMATGLHRVG